MDRVVHGSDGGGGWHLTRVDVLRWRATAFSLFGVLVVLGIVLAASLPRVLAYEGLLDENLALRDRVRELDQRMAEVDRILMRLRLYDAQLRAIQPDGDHGPIDADPESPDDDEPFFELGDGVPLDGLGVRPANAWADSVIARTDNFLALFEQTEPDLNALVAELEDLRALEDALPSAWPATGMLTSGFGYRRSPFGRRTQFHRGIDISNDRDSPITAAAPGRVIRASYNGGYGRMVEVDHGYGITSRYAHMSRIKVSEGDVVQRGQVLGLMGRTGRVTGVHLHFEVRIDGHAVDPLDYLPR
jgi:hypothetical protein